MHINQTSKEKAQKKSRWRKRILYIMLLTFVGVLITCIQIENQDKNLINDQGEGKKTSSLKEQPDADQQSLASDCDEVIGNDEKIPKVDLLEETEKKEKINIIYPALQTKKPHRNAVRLMHYLTDIYGKYMLAGQHIGPDFFELDAIYGVTGKYPALLELDFMDYSPTRVEHGEMGNDTDRAIEWWKNGGIVAFCWHWNAPMDLIDQGPDCYWWSGMYTRATTYDFSKGLADHQSEEYLLLIRDIDAIAVELKKLQDAGVPVLWRPIHEASGGWFWWGNQGAEPYKELWRLMFDRLTNYHKLNNLIWVWNGLDKDWYPGDDVVDIIGEHTYLEPRDYSPLEEEYHKAEKYSKADKMIALTENGPVPDADLIIEKKLKWLWFCTWSETPVVNKERTKYSEEFTEACELKKVYGHEYVITKDELPDFKNYPIYE